MQNCLVGKKAIPDRREKTHSWDIFTSLMLAKWIRRFTKDDINANNIAKEWSYIIHRAFEDKRYKHEFYVDAYKEVSKEKPKGDRLIDFVNFYQISLMSNMLNSELTMVLFDYILHHKSGIYYIYDKQISVLPELFKTRQASRYIGAIELLAEYKN